MLDQTEKESIVKSRISQGTLRDWLIELWITCSVTELNNLSLLRASHIKSWRVSNNAERIDPANGLLLQPTLDHLFDSGLITFDESGLIEISERLSKDDIQSLNLSTKFRLQKLLPKAMSYMQYHRKNIFRYPHYLFIDIRH